MYNVHFSCRHSELCHLISPLNANNSCMLMGETEDPVRKAEMLSVCYSMGLDEINRNVKNKAIIFRKGVVSRVYLVLFA